MRLTVAWGLTVSALLTLIFLFAGSAIVDLLTTDAAVRAMARPYTVWAAIASFAGALAFIMDGIYIGATWSRTMRNMMLLSTALFAVLALALVPRYGNHGLWFAFEVFLSLRGLTLLAALPARRRRTFAVAPG